MRIPVVFFVSLSLFACGGDDDIGPEDCGNAVDDNGDGYVDCADLLCVEDPACELPVGEALVEGSGLVLQDTSSDGSLIAYLDGASSLFVVSPDGGAPSKIADDVDRARFEENILVFYRGVDIATNTADLMFRWSQGGSVEEAGALVDYDATRASNDSAHLYHEERISAGSGTKNLFLDGALIVELTDKERARFSRDSAWLVVGADLDDGGGGLINQVLSFSTTSADSVTLVAALASNNFDITEDSTRVVVAPNERGPVADLAVAPIGGGASSSLVVDGSDRGFALMDGADILAYLVPNDTSNPTDFSLHRIGLDGGGQASLVANGVEEVMSTSADGIVFATAVDATGRANLSFVNLDGSGQRELGLRAIDDGFNSDGSSYVFIDDAAVGNGEPGTLTVYRPAADSLAALGTDVVRSSFVDNGRVVYRDGSGGLRLGELVSAASSLLALSVDDYEEVRDGDGTSGRVAYVVSAGDAPGLYVLDLP